MLTKEQIEKNKIRFLELINSINREGADIEGLVSWLTNKSDFFKAPASTKYHCNFEGGLCLHSLNVYESLVKLCDEFLPGQVPEDTIKIIALLHDASKANFYESYYRNVKNEITGEWEKVSEYRVRDDEHRFIFGNHEQNSEYIVHTFIPLSVSESTAILHHHGGQGWDSAKDDVATVFNKHSIACLLHTADVLATFIIENE